MAASEKGLVEITPESWAYSIGSHIAELAREKGGMLFGVDLSSFKNKFFTIGYQDLGVFSDDGNLVFLSFGLVLGSEWFVVDAHVVYSSKVAPVFNVLEHIDTGEDVTIHMTRVLSPD